ncbi:hypothetical protein FB45DRAFT_1059680 [Roridomyces roridus]|uniref:DUF6533 domain-containing protein n=1 Tax=Roridomyces roridus TaxID=1738132 RepID=A0AAD7BS96_9AGAR|nr:hypothetical protein FB45DRAFT_1059680 [Roridomyces roridus]
MGLEAFKHCKAKFKLIQPECITPWVCYNGLFAPIYDNAASTLSSPALMSAAAHTHFLQFNLQYSSLALLYYDFALTLPKEVKYMWRQPFRFTTALYIGCRYALVANLLYLLAISGKLGSTCDVWYKIVGGLSVIGRASVIAVLTMRTYAVCGANIWILAYMGSLGLACIALDIMHVPGLRCVGPATKAIGHAPEILAIMVIVFESSSAFLTTAQCVMAFRTEGPIATRRQGLMFFLFEQGILYFCIISVFTTAGVILNYRASPGFFQRCQRQRLGRHAGDRITLGSRSVTRPGTTGR